MLVLNRKVGQKIVQGEGANRIVLTYLGTQGGQAKFGFEADRSVPIHREEIYNSIKSSL